MKKERIIRHYIFDLFAISTIVLLNLYNIGNLDIITVLNDEFGYWGSASVICGYDWKSLLKETPFYSVGYSIILLPIVNFFSNTVVMYKVSIVFNVLFLVFEYLIVKVIVKRLNADLAGYAWGISLISVLTTSSMFFSNVAWPEVCIGLLNWILVYLILKCEERNEFRYYLFVCIVGTFSVLVHQRMIPVVILLVTLMIINSARRKEYKKALFVFLLSILMFVIYKNSTSYLEVKLFGGGESLVTSQGGKYVNNNVLSQNMILTYFVKMKDNFVEIIQSFIGKSMVAILASGGLLIVATMGYIKSFCEKDSFLITRTYMIFSCYISILLTAFQASGSYRKDTVVYTRYFDAFLGGAILLGCLYFRNLTRRQIELSFSLMIVFACLSNMVVTWIEKGEGQFNYVCSPLIGSMLYFCESRSFDISSLYMLMKILFVLEGLLGVVIFKAKKNKSVIHSIVLIILVNWLFAFNLNNKININREDIRRNISPIVMQLENNEATIYFVKDSSVDIYSTNAKYIQYRLKERAIEVIEKDELISIGADSWIITAARTVLDNTEIEMICKTDWLKLYHIKDE